MNEPTQVQLSQIKAGNWFQYEGQKYIKCSAPIAREGGTFLAVSLSTGEPAFPANGEATWQVTPIQLRF